MFPLSGHSYSSDEGEVEDEEKSFNVGGLESDDEEEVDEERLINAKKGIEQEVPSEEISPRKRTNSDTSIRKEKKKRKKIIESSDEESDE